MEIPDDVKALLKLNIARKLTPQSVKIRADIEVACYAYEGIDAVKAALRAGLAKSTESLPIKINLIAPPLYVVSTNTMDKDAGIALLGQALDEIKRVILDKKGELNVKMAVCSPFTSRAPVTPTQPRCVTETDDKELDLLMQQSLEDNEEVYVHVHSLDLGSPKHRSTLTTATRTTPTRRSSRSRSSWS